MMIGRVVASQCGQYTVESTGNLFTLTPRGIFRKDNDRILVGDNVEFSSESMTIDKILTRKNHLVRPLVANIDQLVIVSSLEEPLFSFELIFKYLTFANFNNIPAKIIITKTDINKDLSRINEIKKVFSLIEIPVFFVSNKTGEGIESIKVLFKEKITALMGQSGVGKSSFINIVDPLFKREVGEYSKALGRGKHKTKEVILLPFGNGYIADTPGFSSLELNMTKQQLAENFPGFTKLHLECAYSNCLHLSEPNCAVKKSLELGKIPSIVYDCYIKMSSEALTFYRR